MSFRLRPAAQRQIAAIDTRLRAESPSAAEKLKSRLVVTFERLSDFPYSGYVSTDPAVRVALVPGTRYLVIYSVLKNRGIEIVAVVHSAQDRKV